MSMERISAIARAARAAGMHYGQYQALHPSPIPADTNGHIPAYLRPYVKRCEICNRPMPFKNARKYCPDCRAEAERIRSRERSVTDGFEE